ncbi:MAG: metal-dependent transcriptional regulator [Candidatus Bathyarchaeia archaeon]
MTNLSDESEEILERLWITGKENKKICTLKKFDLTENDAGLKELRSLKLINFMADKLELTTTGLNEAAKVIRRHRLAERLLTDIIDASKDFLEEAACKFEHGLRRGVDENICVLLGHPRLCPHGRPIPQGKCCLEEIHQTPRIISKLSDVIAGQEGDVAYLQTKDSKKLQRMISMGILPGTRIKMIQTFPTYVFQLGLSQVAVDKEIADEIYLRLINSRVKSKKTGNKGWRSGRYRFRRRTP